MSRSWLDATSPVPRPSEGYSGWDAPRDGGKRRHNGMDFRVPSGTPVYAVLPGVVRRASLTPGAAGLMVVLEHEGQLQSRYLHLGAFYVRPGMKVKKGQQIAMSGSSGTKTPHLHLDLLLPAHELDVYGSMFGLPAGVVEHYDTGFYKVPVEPVIPIDKLATKIVDDAARLNIPLYVAIQRTIRTVGKWPLIIAGVGIGVSGAAAFLYGKSGWYRRGRKRKSR